MSLLLHNARVADPYGPAGFFENGWILINNGMISEVGSGSAQVQADETVDLNGGLVLPALINGHAHLYSALALGMPGPEKAPATFRQKLERIWWRLDRALDEQSTRTSFKIGLAESLLAGTGTVIDHHSSQTCIDGSLSLLADVAEEFGVRVVIAFETTDRNGSEAMEAALRENERAIRQYQNHPFIKPLFGLHASFTLEDSTLARVAEILEKYPETGIHIHLAEGPEDIEDAHSRGYRSPAERLDRFGLLGPNSIVVHGVFCDDQDHGLLRDREVILVHNPGSNANNRVGVPDLELLEAVNAGLGTDGMQMDMLSEARNGFFIWNARSKRGEATADTLQMLLKNNPAIASSLFDRPLGHIAAGHAADLAIFDYHPRTTLHADNIAGHLLFGDIGRPRHVLTDGKFRVRDWELVGVDEDGLRADAREQAARLWKTMEDL